MGPWRDGFRAMAPLLRAARTVSFSQFAEDQVLARCLAPGRRGRYVDCGAFHPVRFSNTYKLYLKGWQGVTVEPNPEVAAAFRRLRPRDVHVREGVAESPGALRYIGFGNPLLNTFSPRQAEEQRASGHAAVSEIEVPCRPLQAILDEHAAGQPIDLLSVDCEGSDLEVLGSLDWGRSRPTAILVEDFEAQALLMSGGGPSAIERFLRGLGYVPFSQVKYTSFYACPETLRRQAGAVYRVTRP